MKHIIVRSRTTLYSTVNLLQKAGYDVKKNRDYHIIYEKDENVFNNFFDAVFLSYHWTAKISNPETAFKKAKNALKKNKHNPSNLKIALEAAYESIKGEYKLSGKKNYICVSRLDYPPKNFYIYYDEEHDPDNIHVAEGTINNWSTYSNVGTVNVTNSNHTTKIALADADFSKKLKALLDNFWYKFQIEKALETISKVWDDKSMKLMENIHESIKKTYGNEYFPKYEKKKKKAKK